MLKPFAVRIDRGFYGCGVFVPPIQLVFETESEARAAFSKEMDAQRLELLQTPGKPICNAKLTDTTTGAILLNQIVEKAPDGSIVVHDADCVGSVC